MATKVAGAVLVIWLRLAASQPRCRARGQYQDANMIFQCYGTTSDHGNTFTVRFAPNEEKTVAEIPAGTNDFKITMRPVKAQTEVAAQLLVETTAGVKYVRDRLVKVNLPTGSQDQKWTYKVDDKLRIDYWEHPGNPRSQRVDFQGATKEKLMLKAKNKLNKELLLRFDKFEYAAYKTGTQSVADTPMCAYDAMATGCKLYNQVWVREYAVDFCKDVKARYGTADAAWQAMATDPSSGEIPYYDWPHAWLKVSRNTENVNGKNMWKVYKFLSHGGFEANVEYVDRNSLAYCYKLPEIAKFGQEACNYFKQHYSSADQLWAKAEEWASSGGRRLSPTERLSPSEWKLKLAGVDESDGRRLLSRRLSSPSPSPSKKSSSPSPTPSSSKKSSSPSPTPSSSKKSSSKKSSSPSPIPPPPSSPSPSSSSCSDDWNKKADAENAKTYWENKKTLKMVWDDPCKAKAAQTAKQEKAKKVSPTPAPTPTPTPTPTPEKTTTTEEEKTSTTKTTTKEEKKTTEPPPALPTTTKTTTTAAAGPTTTTTKACFQPGFKYIPEDMAGSTRKKDTSAVLCQQRCASTAGCAHFSYWKDGGCHLQDANSDKTAEPESTAGPPSCQGGQATTSGTAGPTVTYPPTTTVTTTTHQATSALPGVITVNSNIPGITKQQVELSTQKGLAQEFAVPESSVSVTATQKRRLTEVRQLPATGSNSIWHIAYNIIVPATKLAAAQAKGNQLAADPSSFNPALQQALTSMGVTGGQLTTQMFHSNTHALDPAMGIWEMVKNLPGAPTDPHDYLEDYLNADGYQGVLPRDLEYCWKPPGTTPKPFEDTGTTTTVSLEPPKSCLAHLTVAAYKGDLKIKVDDAIKAGFSGSRGGLPGSKITIAGVENHRIFKVEDKHTLQLSEKVGAAYPVGAKLKEDCHTTTKGPTLTLAPTTTGPMQTSLQCHWVIAPMCAASFTYKGMQIAGCTTADAQTPGAWCSDTAVFSGKFHKCEWECTNPNTCVWKKDKTCLDKFTYQGQTLGPCTKFRYHTEWCSSQPTFVGGNSKWKYCTWDCGCFLKPGFQCVQVPWTYKGVARKGCIKDDAITGRPWCSHDVTFKGGWSYCSEYCPEPPDDYGPVPKYTTASATACSWKAVTQCKIPFSYKGTSYNQCITRDHKGGWCSTDNTYAGSWAHCKWDCTIPPGLKCKYELAPGCVSSFAYSGQQYSGCHVPDTDHKLPWCSTQATYVNTITPYQTCQYGCPCFWVPDPDCKMAWKLGSNAVDDEPYYGKLAGTTINGCLATSNSKAWCATSDQYDGHFRWCAWACMRMNASSGVGIIDSNASGQLGMYVGVGSAIGAGIGALGLVGYGIHQAVEAGQQRRRIPIANSQVQTGLAALQAATGGVRKLMESSETIDTKVNDMISATALMAIAVMISVCCAAGVVFFLRRKSKSKSHPDAEM